MSMVQEGACMQCGMHVVRCKTEQNKTKQQQGVDPEEERESDDLNQLA